MLWTPHSCSIGPPSCSSMDWSMSLPFLATPRSRPSEDREEREEEALGQSPCREPATRPRHCPSARYGQSQQLRSTEKKNHKRGTASLSFTREKRVHTRWAVADLAGRLACEVHRCNLETPASSQPPFLPLGHLHCVAHSWIVLFKKSWSVAPPCACDMSH
jgi:hypothetical protein